MQGWDPGSFQLQENDDDLPPGWGEEPPESSRRGRSPAAARRPREAGQCAEPRQLPLLFTNAPGSEAGGGRPPRLPAGSRLPWAVQDAAPQPRRAARHRSSSGGSWQQRLAEQAREGPGAGAAAPGEESTEVLRARLSLLRANRGKAPLEETLEGLEALQRRVRAASRDSLARTASPRGHARAGDAQPSAGGCALPPIRRRRAISAPLPSGGSCLPPLSLR
mmetsp:Transcript_15422/g.46601  ORF Transcript_15422/g.46601 Transcript_15422/m.46601 type:complete len:221 (-) Transcript_15422:69-731(-)